MRTAWSQPAMVLAPKPAPSVPIKIAKRSIFRSTGSSGETESSVNVIAAHEKPASCNEMCIRDRCICARRSWRTCAGACSGWWAPTPRRSARWRRPTACPRTPPVSYTHLGVHKLGQLFIGHVKCRQLLAAADDGATHDAPSMCGAMRPGDDACRLRSSIASRVAAPANPHVMTPARTGIDARVK